MIIQRRKKKECSVDLFFERLFNGLVPGVDVFKLRKMKNLKGLELSRVPQRPSAFPTLSEIAGLKFLSRLSVCHFSIFPDDGDYWYCCYSCIAVYIMDVTVPFLLNGLVWWDEMVIRRKKMSGLLTFFHEITF